MIGHAIPKRKMLQKQLRTLATVLLLKADTGQVLWQFCFGHLRLYLINGGVSVDVSIWFSQVSAVGYIPMFPRDSPDQSILPRKAVEFRQMDADRVIRIYYLLSRAVSFILTFSKNKGSWKQDYSWEMANRKW
jgi:hypothetical protein